MAAVALAVAPGAASAASPRGAHTRTVHAGQSIQAAIDAAAPGDTIEIAPGTYLEALQIRKDGLTLRPSEPGSHNVVLMPPASSTNLCTQVNGGTLSGICVLARQLDAQGNVLAPVYDDTIEGLRIVGYNGNGVFGYGTGGLRVTHVQAGNNGGYGIARFVSTGSVIMDNTAWGNGEAGIYVGDSPHADTLVAGNTVAGNGIGVFVRHSHGVRVRDNHSAGNCAGMLLLDDGQPGGEGDLVVSGNRVSENNRLCPPGNGPALSGDGILGIGVVHSVLSGNTVTGNRNQASHLSSGIIMLSATALTGGAALADDTVSNNTLSGNAPDDLLWDGSGRAMHFVNNDCNRSTPTGLCT